MTSRRTSIPAAAVASVTALALLGGGSANAAAPGGAGPGRTQNSPQYVSGSSAETSSGAASAGDDSSGWSNDDAARYWAKERMDQADQNDARSDSEGPSAPPQSSEAADHFGGVPSVGTLYSVGGDLKAHSCTASVVASPGHDIILTAAHCGLGSRMAFVPQYDRAQDPVHQPFGVWAVAQAYVDPHYPRVGQGNYDFAFGRVKKNARGQGVEELTGGNRLTRAPGYDNDVTVIGYPSRSADPQDQAVTCGVRTSRLLLLRQMQMSCGGFYSGTSGSPWLMNFNGTTGDVIGDLGGLFGGGLTPDVSYAPAFGDEAFALFAKAVHDGAGTG